MSPIKDHVSIAALLIKNMWNILGVCVEWFLWSLNWVFIIQKIFPSLILANFSKKLVWSVTDIVVKRGMSVSRVVGIIILSNWASLPAICPKEFIQCAWGNILVLFLTLISTINFIGVPPAIKSSYQVLEALRFSASHEVRWRSDYRARCDFR